MIYAAISECGRRERNEDCVFIPQHKEISLALVADGMGGHSSGNVASRLAAESVVKELKKGGSAPLVTRIENAVKNSNQTLISYVAEHPECHGMGTTMTLAMVFHSYYIAANIGDSRLYHYDGLRLKQITADHSYVAELLAANYITKEQAQSHPKRNVITRAIGISSAVKVDLFERPWNEGDILLLCTDGLYTAVDEREIERVLWEEADLNRACKTLYSIASLGGSMDNISVVLVKNQEEV